MSIVGRKNHCTVLARTLCVEGIITEDQMNSILEMIETDSEDDLKVAEAIVESFKDKLYPDQIK